MARKKKFRSEEWLRKTNISLMRLTSVAEKLKSNGDKGIRVLGHELDNELRHLRQEHQAILLHYELLELEKNALS